MLTIAFLQGKANDCELLENSNQAATWISIGKNALLLNDKASNKIHSCGFGLWQEKERVIRQLKKELEVHDACFLNSHNEAHCPANNAKTINHLVMIQSSNSHTHSAARIPNLQFCVRFVSFFRSQDEIARNEKKKRKAPSPKSSHVAVRVTPKKQP